MDIRPSLEVLEKRKITSALTRTEPYFIRCPTYDVFSVRIYPLFFSGQVDSANIKKNDHYTKFGIVSFGHIFGCELGYTFLSPESPVTWTGSRITPV